MASKRPFRLPSWAPWLLVAALLPFGAVSWLAARAASHRGQAWTILKRVVPRLQDPTQARALWERNPSLHYAYPTPEAFQAELSAWLPRFGGLPPQEPRESQEAYLVGTGPFDLRIDFKGQGGAWLNLAVEDQPSFETGASSGEGIARLVFAEHLKDLAERRDELENRHSQDLWTQFRQVEGLLRDEGGTRRLWEKETGLHHTFKSQEDLLRATAPWRRPLPSLPTDIESAGEARLRSQMSPLGRTESVGYPGPEGLMLWVTWRDGSLQGIEPTLEAHGH